MHVKSHALKSKGTCQFNKLGWVWDCDSVDKKVRFQTK